MRKLVLVVFSLMAMSISAMNPVEGQENGKTAQADSENFEPHWFVSVAVGPQLLFGDHEKQMSFGDKISPALDVAVGRWFTPLWGARLMYSGVSVKGATQNGAHSTGEVYDAGKWLDKQKVNFFNIHAEALFNATNWLLGYNPDRVWDCSPYVGIGVVGVTEKPSYTGVSGNFGLFNAFHVTSALDINLDLRGVITGDDFDGEKGGRGGEGILSLTVGLTYNF